MTTRAILCADVGSTYTKVAAIGLDGVLHAGATHRTTIDTDVLDGLSAARTIVEQRLPSNVVIDDLRVCSSAGGGLRLGVIGNEPLVTATAAHRAGLSAGSRVVAVIAGTVTESDMDALASAAPDVLLVAGGTDGGDETALLDHATTLAASVASRPALRVPVVLAANSHASEHVAAMLRAAGLAVSVVANVLPLIGQLNPGPARLALREAFLEHVIVGKNLSDAREFAAMVRSATPDTVLAGVELFADGHGAVPPSGDVVVVDVGGATTDVYSVLTPDAELEGPRREVAGTAWRSRTVEGDLGLRHTAVGIVSAAEAEGLIDPAEVAALGPAAAYRADHPAFLPDTDDQRGVDLRLTQLAIMVALRRHARGERYGGPDSPLRGGKDLRAVNLVVGSGGVLRHHGDAASAMLADAIGADTAGGYPLPDKAKTVIDTSYVLGMAGLLAPDHPEVALKLMHTHLIAPL
ncbi:glutamate mutase L [Stackebrandtia soli]|uniref:glutamate mutase L n=1 Tax=Stackebrandtia soli TaxID=1892856 RepID=UPI0039E8DBCA